MWGGINKRKNYWVGVGLCLSLFVSGCNPDSNKLAESTGEIDQNTEIVIVDTQANEVATEGAADVVTEVFIETYSENGRRTYVGDVTPAELEALNLSNTKLAFSLIHSSSTENIAKFPYGLTKGYSMLAAGAADETLDSIFQKLYNPAVESARLHRVVNGWDALVSANLANIWNQESAFWGQESYLFSVEYLDLLADNYGSEMIGLNLSAGSDKPVLASVSPQTRVVAVDSHLIQTPWSANEVTITRIEDGQFETVGASAYKTPMIYFFGALSTVDAEQYRAVQLPIQNNNLAFIVLMPHEDQFMRVRGQLNPRFLSDLLDSFELTTTDFYLPEFALTTELNDLAPYLAATRYRADFSKVNGSKALYTKLFEQQGRVATSISGIEFFSRTSFQLDLISASPEPSASDEVEQVIPEEATVSCYDPNLTKARPFIFTLLEKQTGAVLVVGQYVAPASQTVSNLPRGKSVSVGQDLSDMDDVYQSFGFTSYENIGMGFLIDDFSLSETDCPHTHVAPSEWNPGLPGAEWGAFSGSETGASGPF